MVGKALTEQQRAFVAELLADTKFNVTEAARKAGYKNPNKMGAKLLLKPHVQEAITKAQEERIERCELKADDVLAYLKTALFYRITDLFEEDGDWQFKSPDEIPDDIARIIEEVNVTETTSENGTTRNVKVKTLAKSKTLELAMKHLGLFSADKHEVKHFVDWETLYGQPDDKTVEDDIDDLST